MRRPSRRSPRPAQRGVVRRGRILLQRALQLGKLRRGRLVLFRIVDGGGSYFLQAVVERILLGRRGDRLQNVVEQSGAGGALNARNVDAISRYRPDQYGLSRIAVQL